MYAKYTATKQENVSVKQTLGQNDQNRNGLTNAMDNNMVYAELNGNSSHDDVSTSVGTPALGNVNPNGGDANIKHTADELGNLKESSVVTPDIPTDEASPDVKTDAVTDVHLEHSGLGTDHFQNVETEHRNVNSLADELHVSNPDNPGITVTEDNDDYDKYRYEDVHFENIRTEDGGLSEDVMHHHDNYTEEEDLNVLSKRIAKKSLSSSQLYMLCTVMDEDEDFQDLGDEAEFVAPNLQLDVKKNPMGNNGSDDSKTSAPAVLEPAGPELVAESNDPESIEKPPVDTDKETKRKPELRIAKDPTTAEDYKSDPTSPRSQIIPQPKPRASHDASSANRTEAPSGIKEGVRSSESHRTSRKQHGGAIRQTASRIHKTEDEEENFVLTALCRAVEDGNLEAMKNVLEEATSFNINQSNKQGETLLHTAASNGHLDIMKFLQEKGISLNANDKHGDNAVYWAARQGHLHVIKYLMEQGVCLDTQNKAGEAPIHVAARYGHLDLIEFLCKADVEVNVQDKLGETALHTVSWHGLPPSICAMLCVAGCKVDTRNKENETPLHCAASRGNLECVRVLLSHGASLNVQDKRLNTPLHLSCRRQYVSIALLLLHAGCAFDLPDCINETPLHPASREGLLPVVQTMCAYGCQVDITNKGGLTPLHQAARSGHIEVVRCLLLSGSEPELPNKDGVNSEIMALAQGHQDVAELLAKLKPERREICIKQLIPTSEPLSRIKVKVFGSSGVGKTTLIDSLKCGYLSSFFRKARISNSSSSTNVHRKVQENGSISRQQSLPTQLSFEIAHDAYTQGVDVQQVNIGGGVGDLSIWEFSGYEPYYGMYDHFIGDPNCVHMVVFSLADPQDVQLSQILFWLNFLKARIAPMEPIGPAGRLPWPARVQLVATHADKADCVKNSSGALENIDANILLATVKHKFESDLFIQDEMFVADAHLAMSHDVKSLRLKLGFMKNQIIQFLPCSNGFLEATVGALAIWRKALSDYPVVTWPIFMEYVRSKVNLLTSDEHLKELMCQLQLLGEVIYIETEGEQDLVVLNPKWLCSDVIGHLLSHDQLRHSRPTGCFSIDDFQLMCPETDAKDMLVILEALELCTRCQVDGEIEYEFPCLNFVEMIPGLWDKDDTRMRNSVYGGVRIHCPRGMNNQLLHMFPRIQTHLRREVLSEQTRPDSDLYQWYHGSKFCSGNMECLITLSQSEQVVEVKCRAPEEFRTSLYYFQEDLCDIVLDVIEDSCPGLCLEKYILSATELKAHRSSVFAYTPKDILSAQLEGGTSITLAHRNINEEFIDLIGFGSEEIWNNITPGIDLHAHYLSIHARRRLSMLLDPPDHIGRDWCLLAVSLGLTNDLPNVDQSENQMVRSRTDAILDMWSQEPSSTIAVLIRRLRELGRQDAADALLTVSPLYHVFQENETDNKTQKEQTPYSSENTLSSSNLSR